MASPHGCSGSSLVVYLLNMVDSSPPALLRVIEAAQIVRQKTNKKPRLGLVLGSGLGPLADKLESPVVVPYADLPHMPSPGVAGHSGRLSLGSLNGVQTACLEGRVHLYEGHEPERVVFGARLLAQLGCEVVLLTNAAGAVTPDLLPGSVLLIHDHLNLTGRNPLVGYRARTEFLDMSNCYDAKLRAQAKWAASAIGMELREGVYAGLVGPTYETKAEVTYLERIGAQAVGMSTVLETIALCDMNVRVMALSCITNAAAGVKGAILDHGHVQSVANRGAVTMERLILRWVSKVFAEER